LKKSIGSSRIVVDKTNNGGEKPMLYLDDIKVEFERQGFQGTHIGISPNKDKSVLFLENAYGYRNFKRFRNRILHMFSHQMQKQAIA
jgi:hypothetical protein